MLEGVCNNEGFVPTWGGECSPVVGVNVFFGLVVGDFLQILRYDYLENVQTMPIPFAVTIVRLKVCTTIASPLTLTSIQGHKCVSNLTTF